MKLLFWLTYDNLGRVAVVSVLFWIVALLVVTVPAAIGGLVFFSDSLAERKEARIADFFDGLRRYWLRSTVLGAIIAGVTAVLALNLVFYVRITVRGGHEVIGSVLSGLTLWMIVLWLMTLPYMYPAAVSGGNRLGRSVKLAILLAAANGWRTVLLAVNLAGLMTLCLVSSVGTVFLMPAVCGILSAVSYRDVIRRYGRRDTGENSDDEDDALYIDRGLRDILKPWDV